MKTLEATKQLNDFSRRYWGIEISGSFAESVYNSSTIDELIDLLEQRTPDYTAMKTWGLTTTQWRSQIAFALRVKLADLINSSVGNSIDKP